MGTGRYTKSVMRQTYRYEMNFNLYSLKSFTILKFYIDANCKNKNQNKALCQELHEICLR